MLTSSFLSLWARAQEDLDHLMMVEELETEARLFEAIVSFTAKLTERGIVVSRFPLATVMEGTLPSGEVFYFRCRYQACRLILDGEMFTQATKLDGTAFEKYEAGCLTLSEAMVMLSHLLGEAGRSDAKSRVDAALAV